MKVLERSLVQSRYISYHIVLALDTLIAALSSLSAYILVTFLVDSVVLAKEAFCIFVLSFIVSLFSLVITRTYRHVIRYSTLKDLWRISASVFLKGSVMAVFVFLFMKWEYLSVNQLWLFVVFGMMFSIVSMVGARVLMIIFFEIFTVDHSGKRRQILIYGTDAKSVSLKLRFNNSREYAIVGFCVSEDVYKSYRILGLPIYNISDEHNFTDIISQQDICGILFADWEDIRKEQERLISYIEKKGIKALIAPSINETINGEVVNKEIRSIKVEDLLGRDEIRINIDDIITDFCNKTVLITGSAGSIGSELCRQVAGLPVKKIIFFDSAETPLHHLKLEFEQKFPQLDFVSIIGDVRIRSRVKMVFEKYAPEIILHAAAYKHVPLMEDNPCEAILVNVVGTRNVADMAVRYHAEKMVMVSTDKAVNPTNIMGASKRLAEIYVQALGCAINEGRKAGSTSFITTRFGNVLGSNGSVIPHFKKQIEKGGPVTVTHPEIIRYFMTIPEACRLVLEAVSLGMDNEVFVFEMGKPVKIADLARRMITLAGFRPEIDIKIQYTGLRPGEKLYEELLCNGENTLPTENRKIKIAKVRPYAYEDIEYDYERLEKLAREINVEETVRLMKKLVPEFISSANSVFSDLDKKQMLPPVWVLNKASLLIVFVLKSIWIIY